MMGHMFAGENILRCLVFNKPSPCFLNRHLRKGKMGAEGLNRSLADNVINLFLIIAAVFIQSRECFSYKGIDLFFSVAYCSALCCCH